MSLNPTLKAQTLNYVSLSFSVQPILFVLLKYDIYFLAICSSNHNSSRIQYCWPSIETMFKQLLERSPYRTMTKRNTGVEEKPTQFTFTVVVLSFCGESE